jgi:hypothetical protein
MPFRYQQPTRYLARAWLDVAPISPNEAVLNDMRALLGRADLSMAIAMDGTVQRLALLDNTGLQIVLPGESFDVIRVPIVAPDGSDVPMMPFPEFAAEAGAIFAAFARSRPDRLARRLALVQEGLLESPPVLIDQLPGRLFHVPEPFRTHPPFEWDWRLATRVERNVGGVREPTNTIVAIKRASGILTRGGGTATPFDRIRLDVDINTAPDNATARFRVTDIEAFFRACTDWHAEVWRQTEELSPQDL